MHDEPLRAEDLANLWVEDPHTPFHIALVAELEAGPLVRGDGSPDLARFAAELAARVHRVPALGRRMVRRRLGTARPVWRDDSRDRPERHVRCVALPPGQDFVTWAGNRILEPLDRSRPLWRADVVGGLPDGRVGLLVVVHHVVADGLTGVTMISRLLDRLPDTDAAGNVPDPELRRVPDPAAPTGRAPEASQVGPLGRVMAALGDFGTRTTPTSLPRRLGPGSRLLVLEESLDDLTRTGHALGATVNDLLVAAVTGGLRALLAARGELRPGLVARASVPVGRTGAGQTAGMLAAGLPVGKDDPVARLAAIVRETTEGKKRIRAGGGHVMDVTRLPLPLAHLAVRGLRRIAGSRIDLFITDVPGPPGPLWLAGARLVRAVPVAPLVQGVPIGVAALSYDGRLAIAVNVDAAVSDVDVFADAMRAEFDHLARAQRAASTRPVTPPKETRPPSGPGAEAEMVTSSPSSR
jgi:WS/DGAT/MGAT family acyltransferase